MDVTDAGLSSRTPHFIDIFFAEEKKACNEGIRSTDLKLQVEKKLFDASAQTPVRHCSRTSLRI